MKVTQAQVIAWVISFLMGSILLGQITYRWYHHRPEPAQIQPCYPDIVFRESSLSGIGGLGVWVLDSDLKDAPEEKLLDIANEEAGQDEVNRAVFVFYESNTDLFASLLELKARMVQDYSAKVHEAQAYQRKGENIEQTMCRRIVEQTKKAQCK